MPRKKVESLPSTMGVKRAGAGHEPSTWRAIDPNTVIAIEDSAELQRLVSGLGVEATFKHVIDLSGIWAAFHSLTPYSERPAATEIASATEALEGAIATIEKALRTLKAAADTADSAEPERVDQFTDTKNVLVAFLARDELRNFAAMPPAMLRRHVEVVALHRLQDMGEAFNSLRRDSSSFAARGPGTKRQIALVQSLRDYFEATTGRPAKLSASKRPDTFHGFIHGFWRIKWPTATGDDTRAALPDLSTLRAYLAK